MSNIPVIETVDIQGRGYPVVFLPSWFKKGDLVQVVKIEKEDESKRDKTDSN